MTSSRQTERAAAAWLARRDGNGWSAHDQAKLDAWLSASIEHRIAFLRLEAAWQESDRLKALGAGVPAGQVPPRGRWGLAPFHTQTDLDGRDEHDPGSLVPSTHPAVAAHHAPSAPLCSRRRLRMGRSLVAAVVLMALALGVVLRPAPSSPTTIYRTALGGQESIRLTDGSEAELSSDTRLLASLSPRERDIDIQQGEAFFAVAHDRARPFVVSAGGQRAIAVGTRFAVRHDADRVRVVVTQGLVQLQPADDSGGAATLLPAGSVALVSGDDVLVQHLPIEQALQYLSWRDGYVAFHDTPLVAAVAEFNRYNARKIVIVDPTIASLRVGGNFRWSNAQAFVRLLQQAFPIQAARRGDQILLQRRN